MSKVVSTEATPEEPATTPGTGAAQIESGVCIAILTRRTTSGETSTRTVSRGAIMALSEEAGNVVALVEEAAVAACVVGVA